MTPEIPEPALAFSLLGYALRVADPGALRLLLAPASLAVLGAVALARRRRALRRSAGALAACVAPGANLWRPSARLASALLGLALLALALSRPQCGTRTEVVRRTGVDLAIVLDASRSMLARDVRPDRLARAKLELAALLDALGGDRVAVVAFAADAFALCPLTSDLAAAKLFLRAVDPDELPRQGTSLARALAAAREALLASESRDRAKVVLVASDGEDHEGGVASAARALAQDGIRLYALAVGTPAGAPVPPREGARRRAERLTHLDLATLRLVADQGGGEVYDVSSPGRGLAAFRTALDRMARADAEGRVTVTWEERFAAAALPGFLLLLASILLRECRTTTPASRGASPSPPRSGGEGRGEGATPTSTPTSTPISTSTPVPSPTLPSAALPAVLALLLAGFSPFHAEEEHVRAGNERLTAGDPAAARAAYDEAERAVGPHPEIDFDRGNAAAREGRLADARAAWERAAAAGSPALASRALQNLGTALAASGDPDGAVRAFSDALAKDPSNEDARWNLEVLLRKGGGREDAPAERAPARAERPERRAGTGEPERRGEPAPPERREGAERAEPREARAQDARRREPLSRQAAEALLDALRARERQMPLLGRDQGNARSEDAEKDW